MRKFAFMALAAMRLGFAQEALPTEWIDASTGHRVVRLSRDEGTQSLYFNQNAYTPDGKKLIVTTAGGGIATITLLRLAKSNRWWRSRVCDLPCHRKARSRSADHTGSVALSA